MKTISLFLLSLFFVLSISCGGGNGDSTGDDEQTEDERERDSENGDDEGINSDPTKGKRRIAPLQIPSPSATTDENGLSDGSDPAPLPGSDPAPLPGSVAPAPGSAPGSVVPGSVAPAPATGFTTGSDPAPAPSTAQVRDCSAYTNKCTTDTECLAKYNCIRYNAGTPNNIKHTICRKTGQANVTLTLSEWNESPGQNNLLCDLISNNEYLLIFATNTKNACQNEKDKRKIELTNEAYECSPL